MFFSSHVTGQSRNPAKGLRFTLNNAILYGNNLPQHNYNNKRTCFLKLSYPNVVKYKKNYVM